MSNLNLKENWDDSDDDDETTNKIAATIVDVQNISKAAADGISKAPADTISKAAANIISKVPVISSNVPTIKQNNASLFKVPKKKNSKKKVKTEEDEEDNDDMEDPYGSQADYMDKKMGNYVTF